MSSRLHRGSDAYSSIHGATDNMFIMGATISALPVLFPVLRMRWNLENATGS